MHKIKRVLLVYNIILRVLKIEFIILTVLYFAIKTYNIILQILRSCTKLQLPLYKKTRIVIGGLQSQLLHTSLLYYNI